MLIYILAAQSTDDFQTTGGVTYFNLMKLIKHGIVLHTRATDPPVHARTTQTRCFCLHFIVWRGPETRLNHNTCLDVYILARHDTQYIAFIS